MYDDDHFVRERFSGGLALARLGYGPSHIGYISHAGETAIPPFCYDAYPFREGRAFFMADGEHYGVIASDGRIVVEPRFDSFARPGFVDGLAGVRIGDRSGFIDTTGEFAIEPKYHGFGPFSEGFAWVRPEGRDDSVLIDRTGAIVFDQPVSYHGHFSEGLVQISLPGEDRFTFLDASGRIALCGTENGLLGRGDFHEGRAKVIDSLSNWIGYIDRSGNVVVKPQFFFSHAQDFSEGLAAVGDGEQWGYIDRRGEWVIPLRFREAKSFSEGLAAVAVDGTNEDGDRCNRWGYIDASGEFVLPPRYDSADPFSEGCAWVSASDGPDGYIDTRGEWVWRKDPP